MLDAIHSLIAWTPMGLPAFLFVITLVVFFHELGHFLVARWFGVTVEVFSVGFGGEIFGWNDRHGTRWKVSWLPIGGYVKFAGDADAASRPDVEAAAHDPEVKRLIEKYNPTGQGLPLVVCPDGSCLSEPSQDQVAEKAGLRTRAELEPRHVRSR